MKITIEPYNKNWPHQFSALKAELAHLLNDFDPVIEHFGSTSVPGLAAKPVIDILIGIKDTSLFGLLIPMVLQNQQYIYYQVFDEDAPNRRLFVRLKDELEKHSYGNTFNDFATIPHAEINQWRLAHVHIWQINSPDWIRHLAFRDYLIAHPEIKSKYEEKVKQDREQYEKDVVERAKKAKLQWEADINDKRQLSSHAVFDYIHVPAGMNVSAKNEHGLTSILPSKLRSNSDDGHSGLFTVDRRSCTKFSNNGL